MKCLLCGSGKTKFLFNHSGKDIYLKRLGADDFRLKWFKCSGCGVYFSIQHPDIEAIYADESLYDGRYDEEGIRRRFRMIMRLKREASDNASRVKRVKSFHGRYAKEFKIGKPPYRVLDVGAGLGVFLARFINNSYKGSALEINQVAVKHLREKLRIPVHACPLEQVKAAGTFDLITMNRVMEHIKQPIVVLKAAKDIMSRRGIVYLELPDSISYELCGKKSEAFASGHYMVYNPESISHLLRRSGFDILAMSRVLEPSGKRTIYAFARKAR